MASAFRAQGRAFLSRFATLKARFPLAEAVAEPPAAPPGPEDWEPLFDEAALETLQAFLTPLDVGVTLALQAGALTGIADVGLQASFSLGNPRAVAYLEGHALAAARHINATTKRDISEIVTKGVQEGWSYDQIAKAITAKYGEYAAGRPQQHVKSRAHGIALYEAGEAYCEGNRLVALDLEDAGLEMEHSWLTAKDDRVDPECRANEAQGWIPLKQAYQSGHLRPLAHYACRCDELIRRKPSEVL